MSNNIKYMYPLTDLQQGMLLLTQASESDDQYSVQLHLCLKGDIDEKLLTGAFQALVDRHEILRTVFMHRKVKTPKQVVMNKRKAGIQIVDIRDRKMNQADMKNYWASAKPFDFEQDMLMNLAWFKFKDQDVASFRFHHIILDGWSIGIVMKDFEDLINGRSCAISQKELFPFKSYVEAIGKQDARKALAHWESYLDGYEEHFTLVPKNKKMGEQFSKQSISLDREIFVRLDTKLKQSGISMNTAFQTAWGIVLQKYLYQDDVVYGAVVSGRNLPIENIETGVGLFINTLPVRITIRENDTLKDVLKRVQKHAENSCNYESCALSDIQKVSSLKENMFDHIMAFENYPFEVGQEGQASKVRICEVFGLEKNNYGLNVKAVLKRDLFSVEFTFNNTLFTETEIQRLLSYLMVVLQQMENNMNLKVEDLNLLTEEAKRKILYAFNDTAVDFSQENLTDFLCKCLTKNPSYSAITGKDITYTYEDVERLSNQIARFFRDKGLGAEDVVALHMKRTPDVMLAMLGLLKSGIAFLPLDTKIPEQRIQYMLEDSCAKLLVTEDEEMASQFNSPVIRNLLGEASLYSEKPFENVFSDSDLAYIIYTSGTTGTPKGAMMERRGLINLIMDMQKRYEEGNIPVVAISSISFDMFIYEYTYCLGRQGEFVIANEEERMDMEELFKLFEKRNIQSMITTPSRIAAMLQHPDAPRLFRNFKTLIIGGERLKPDVLEKANELVGGEVQNAYGPTETTVICTVKENLKAGDKITIGKPLLNTRLLVLDKNLELVPEGAIGELYIMTPGILRGYIHNEELTAKVKKPCKALEQSAMYKSGDFVRWTEDGEIEFIGRIDGQHKIRGQRIELEEIDYKISSLSGITDVVTLSIGENQMTAKLVSFYSGEKKEEAILKDKLKEMLPVYMVPDYLVYIRDIPTNTNGKADKYKLKSYFEILELKTEIQEAANETQRVIRDIWCEILGRENVSVDANFYEMGANSLLAMSLASRLSNTFKKTIKVSDVLKNLTIIEQETLVLNSGQAIEIPQMPNRKKLPLSSAEKRMYVLEKQTEGSNAYNAYNAFSVLSAKGEVDERLLVRAVQALAERHESLRIKFVEDEEGVHKETIENAEIPIYYHQMEKASFLENGFNLIKGFDLQAGPLWEVHLVELTDQVQERMILMNFSHIIMDGTSMDLLMEDFRALMSGRTPGRKVRKYSDYAEFESSLELRSMEDYFISEFKDTPDAELVTDYPRINQKSFKGKTLKLEIDRSTCERLKAFCKSEKLTPNSCLMALYHLLLMKFGNRKDFTIGTIVANRDIEDTQKMIGMFANTLPVRTRLENQENLSAYLKNYQRHFEETLKHQRYPYDLLIKKINQDAGMKKDIFNHFFVYQYLLHGTEGFIAKDVSYEPCLSFKTPEISKFDLSFEVMDHGETMEVLANYSTDLCHEQTIRNLLDSYAIMIEAATQGKTKLKDFNAVSTLQEARLREWGQGKTLAYIEADMVVRKLEQYAEEHGALPAVKMSGETLSYAELKRKSDCLAHEIISRGIPEKSVIAIYMGRSIDFVVSMLGVMKARCSYLPIDKALPQERIKYMLQDSNCALILTDRKVEYPSLNVNDFETFESVEYDTAGKWCMEDPSYIIYTSGTTGKPKGVKLNQRSLTSFVKGLSTYFDFGSGDVLLSLASVSFDMFSSEVWMSLYSGMCLVLTDDEVRYSVEETARMIVRDNITALLTTPSRVENSFESFKNAGGFNQLKYMIFGGEALKEELIQKINVENEGIYIFNAYGPTEATMHCTVEKVTSPAMNSIGRPIPNAAVYILDEDLQMMIPGARGELCIGGDALADGYINMEEETKRKFVTLQGVGRIYRTGDFARWNADGKLEYLGRMDTQIKINGYRVEVLEIEEMIQKLTGQQPCKVIAFKEDKKWQLAAFSTSKDDLGAVHENLVLRLPYYMVPKYIVKIDSLPETVNGKVDELVLTRYLETQKAHEETAAAEKEIEKLLEKILKQKINGLDTIDMNSHFMDIGGDSFKAIEVISDLRKKGYTISINDFMNQMNLRKIADRLKRIETVSKSEVFIEETLSPMHQKILVSNDIASVNGFVQTIALQDDKPIKMKKLHEILKAIMQEHPMLRSYYPIVDGQRVHTYGTCEEKLVFQGLTMDEETSEFVQEIARAQEKLIDIEKSLFRVIVVNGRNSSYCIMTLHHFLLDTVSWMILLEEIINLYNGTKETVQLSSSTFHEWLQMSLDYVKSDAFDAEASYWDELQRKSERICNANHMKDMALWEHAFTLAESSELMNLKNRWRVSLDALLLSAFGHMLTRKDRTEEVMIEMESHGRNFDYGVLDLSQTIGWFTSPFPMMLEKRGQHPNQTALEIEERLKQVPNKGRGYSLKRYLGNDRGYNMEPKYVFNNLGEVRASVEHNEGLHLSDIQFHNIPPQNFCVNYEIYCYFRITQGRLSIGLQYNTEKYSEDEAMQFRSELMGYISELTSCSEAVS